MTIAIQPVLADAWALFRRDRDWLLRVAGPFLFLPAFALALLVPAPPSAPAAAGVDREARALLWAQSLSEWAGAHGHWYLIAYAVGAFGSAVLYAACLDPGACDLRGAIGRAGRMTPRYLLALLLVAPPTAAGLLLWLLPGLYIMGRTMLTGPALFAERPGGAVATVLRGFALTRGAGLPLMALAAITLLGGYVLGEPFLLLDRQLRAAASPNPFAIALANAGAAAAATVAGLAQVLIAVAAYRRLAAR